jgi:hypothetical protein
MRMRSVQDARRFDLQLVYHRSQASMGFVCILVLSASLGSCAGPTRCQTNADLVGCWTTDETETRGLLRSMGLGDSENRLRYRHEEWRFVPSGEFVAIPLDCNPLDVVHGTWESHGDGVVVTVCGSGSHSVRTMLIIENDRIIMRDGILSMVLSRRIQPWNEMEPEWRNCESRKRQPR